MDNFIGWSLPDKVAMLRGAQEAQLTGQVVKLQTAHGVYTEFSVSQATAQLTLRRLEESIAMEPEPDADSEVHKVWAGCVANQRPAVTRQSHY